MWEPTVVNLAHAYRKLKIYEEAVKFYEKALALSTRSMSTYPGLAYAYHLQDNLNAAITYCRGSMAKTRRPVLHRNVKRGFSR